jgi:hypothetical protein
LSQLQNSPSLKNDDFEVGCEEALPQHASKGRFCGAESFATGSTDIRFFLTIEEIHLYRDQ